VLACLHPSQACREGLSCMICRHKHQISPHTFQQCPRAHAAIYTLNEQLRYSHKQHRQDRKRPNHPTPAAFTAPRCASLQ
jgi:hypothetical protein